MGKSNFEVYQALLDRMFEEARKFPINSENIKALAEAISVIQQNPFLS